MTPRDAQLHVDEVQREVSALTGATVADAVALDGGASRTGWRMRLTPAKGRPTDVYVRVGGAAPGAVARMYNVTREASIVRDVVAAGVPAPGVLAISDSMPLAVMEFIQGTSEFGRIHAARSRRGVERQYLTALRRLHELDVRDVASLADGEVGTVADATARDLDTWQRLASEDGINADPLVHMAEQWLRRNVVAGKAAARVVHGDAGPGNFMFHNGHVTALVDWELAHVGDPVEDLGWILLRAGDADVDELKAWVSLFTRVSRTSVSADAVHFHRVLAMYKTTVAISSSLAANALGRTSHLLQLLSLYRYLLGWLLADALHVSLPPKWPTSDELPVNNRATRLAVEAADMLERALAEGNIDAASKLTVRRARLVLGFFARREALWPAASEEICRNAGALLGAVPGSVERALIELRPYADLSDVATAAQALRLVMDVEQRRLALWPGLPRRAAASCRRSDELVDGGST